MGCRNRSASPTAGDSVRSAAITLDQREGTKSLDEITKVQDESGFWEKFIVIGLGHIVTLRVPPARLREVKRREIYATYDAREIAKTLRERALKK